MFCMMTLCFYRSRVYVWGLDVVSVMSDIFLYMLDRAIKFGIGREVIRVFRYGDDYLILFMKVSGDLNYDCIKNMLRASKSKSCGLNITRNIPVDRRLDFLDSNEDHVCWWYWSKTNKKVCCILTLSTRRL